MMSLVKLD